MFVTGVGTSLLHSLPDGLISQSSIICAEEGKGVSKLSSFFFQIINEFIFDITGLISIIIFGVCLLVVRTILVFSGHFPRVGTTIFLNPLLLTAPTNNLVKQTLIVIYCNRSV